MKRCPRCTRTLSLDSFYRQKSRKDGRAVYCKQCRKEQKQAYLATPEGRTQYLTTAQQRRKTRLMEDSEYRRRYYSQTDTRKRNTVYTPEALEYMPIILGDPCVYCGATATTVDHIIPVSKGGSSDWDNLAPACGSCNSRKNDRPLLGFMLNGRSDPLVLGDHR